MASDVVRYMARAAVVTKLAEAALAVLDEHKCEAGQETATDVETVRQLIHLIARPWHLWTS